MRTLVTGLLFILVMTLANQVGADTTTGWVSPTEKDVVIGYKPSNGNASVIFFGARRAPDYFETIEETKQYMCGEAQAYADRRGYELHYCRYRSLEPGETVSPHIVAYMTQIDGGHSYNPNGSIWNVYGDEWVCDNPNYPVSEDTDGDGEPERCYQRKCACSENWQNGECVTRDPYYNTNHTGFSAHRNKGGLQIVSDENNQGLQCAYYPKLDDNSTCTEVGNPIDCANGVKRQSETDYRAAVGGLSYTRTYESNLSVSLANERAFKQLGREIPEHFEFVSPSGRIGAPKTYVPGLARLEMVEEFHGIKLARVHFPEGHSRVFLWRDDDRRWSVPTAELGKLETVAGGYRYTTVDGTEYHFNEYGELTEKVSRKGRRKTISRDGETVTITGPFGRRLTQHYKTLSDGTRLMTRLVDPAGNETRYEYNDAGHVTRVVYPDDTPYDDSDNPTKRYLYESTDTGPVLVGIVDENGDRTATYAYDEHNRAVLTEHGEGAQKITLDYSRQTDGITVARFYQDETAYREVTYHHKRVNQTRKLTRVEVTDCTNDCNAGATVYEYDRRGFLSRKTDPEGTVTEYSYNGRGLQTSRKEAAGTTEEQVVGTRWHEEFDVPKIVTEVHDRRIHYAYDSQGNRLRRTITNWIGNYSRTTRWQYNELGQVTQIDGPRTDVEDVTTFEYDTMGNRIRITNPLGHVTEITDHDAHGNPKRIVDPNGVVTELEYDARQRLIRRTAAAGTASEATTRFDYDPAGQLVAVTLADGSRIGYEYDTAHRLVAITDNQGNRIEYTLDAQGNRTAERTYDEHGTLRRRVERVYNAMSRLQSVIDADGNKTAYDYDADGDRTAVIDPNYETTRHEYDALDRLVRTVDPLGGETRYTYDEFDRVTSVTDPGGATTTYEYNLFGDTTAVHSPDAGTTSYKYDDAGNRIEATDARGITKTYTYDALNRLTAIHFPDASEDIRFEYDTGDHGIGRLTAIVDPSGRTEYTYDARGNVVTDTRRIKGQTFVTRYEYDKADRLVGMTYPSGREITFERGDAGRVRAIRATIEGSTRTIASGIEYEPFGPMRRLAYGNGLTLDREYDLDYQLMRQSVPGVEQLSYTWSAKGNITAIQRGNNSTRSESFDYDALNRLTSASGAYGDLGYQYDANGNRTQLTEATTEDTVVTDYQIGTANNRLLEAANDSEVTPFEYDAAGNTIRKGDQTLDYNQRNRLSRVTDGEGEILGEYEYNALGQRVWGTGNPGPDYEKLAEQARGKAAALYEKADTLENQAEAKNAKADQKEQQAAELEEEAAALEAEIADLEEEIAWYDERISKFTETAEHHRELASKFRDRIVEDPNWIQRWLNRIWRWLAERQERVADRIDRNADKFRERSEPLREELAEKEQQLAVLNEQIDTLYAEAADLRNEADALSADAESAREEAVAWTEKAEEYERLAEENPGPTITRYVFDQQGRMIGEYAEDGTPIREYVYFQGAPIALIQNGELYWYHTDHLGTPKHVTDVDQNIVWDGVYRPFGEVDVRTDGFRQPVRFPGQYEDAATGLYQNWYRSYDATLSRYMSTDPIGINGGMNIWSYASSNPVVNFDSKGLYCETFSIPVGFWGDTGEDSVLDPGVWRLVNTKVDGPEKGRASGPPLMALVNASTQQLKCIWQRTKNVAKKQRRRVVEYQYCVPGCGNPGGLSGGITYEYRETIIKDVDSKITGMLISIHELNYNGICEKRLHPNDVFK